MTHPWVEQGVGILPTRVTGGILSQKRAIATEQTRQLHNPSRFM